MDKTKFEKPVAADDIHLDVANSLRNTSTAAAGPSGAGAVVEKTLEERKIEGNKFKNSKKSDVYVAPLKKAIKMSDDAMLLQVAKGVIIDGAAVFFPDKEARRKQLFNMMGCVNVSKRLLGPVSQNNYHRAN